MYAIEQQQPKNCNIDQKLVFVLTPLENPLVNYFILGCCGRKQITKPLCSNSERDEEKHGKYIIMDYCYASVYKPND